MCAVLTSWAGSAKSRNDNLPSNVPTIATLRSNVGETKNMDAELAQALGCLWEDNSQPLHLDSKKLKSGMDLSSNDRVLKAEFLPHLLLEYEYVSR